MILLSPSDGYIVNLISEVFKTTNSGSPSLNHFSAGVGRTGTYIALDALYREGQNTGKINVPMYVNTMRKDRMNMIQGEVRSLITNLIYISVFI